MLYRIVAVIFLAGACWNIYSAAQAWATHDLPWLRLLAASVLVLVAAYLLIKRKP